MRPAGKTSLWGPPNVSEYVPPSSDVRSSTPSFLPDISKKPFRGSQQDISPRQMEYERKVEMPLRPATDFDTANIQALIQGVTNNFESRLSAVENRAINAERLNELNVAEKDELQRRISVLEQVIERDAQVSLEMRERVKGAEDQANKMRLIVQDVQEYMKEVGGPSEFAEARVRTAELRSALEKQATALQIRSGESDEKSRVLFGEVVRVAGSLDDFRNHHTKRISDLEDAVNKIALASEQTLVSTKENSKTTVTVSSQLDARTVAVESDLVELRNTMMQMQNTQKHEMKERESLREDTSKWIGDVRSALLKSDAIHSKRLGEALGGIGARIGEVQETSLAVTSKGRESATIRIQEVARKSEERIQMMVQQIQFLEQQLKTETRKRELLGEEVRVRVEQQVQNMSLENAREKERRAIETETLQRELVDRAEAISTDSEMRSTKAASQMSRGVEEVLRAEVRQRMEGETKITTRVEEVVQALSKALEQVRTESEDDGARMGERIDAIENNWPIQLQGLRASFEDSLVKLGENVAQSEANIEKKMDMLEKLDKMSEQELEKRVTKIEKQEAEDTNRLEELIDDTKTKMEEALRENDTRRDEKFSYSTGVLQSFINDTVTEVDERLKQLTRGSETGRWALKRAAEARETQMRDLETFVKGESEKHAIQATMDQMLSKLEIEDVHKECKELVLSVSERQEQIEVSACIGRLVAAVEADNLSASVTATGQQSQVAEMGVRSLASLLSKEHSERLEETKKIRESLKSLENESSATGNKAIEARIDQYEVTQVLENVVTQVESKINGENMEVRKKEMQGLVVAMQQIENRIESIENNGKVAI